jgi:hypothetical protein
LSPLPLFASAILAAGFSESLVGILLLAGQVASASATGRQFRFLNQHVWYAFFDREADAATLTD